MSFQILREEVEVLEVREGEIEVKDGGIRFREKPYEFVSKGSAVILKVSDSSILDICHIEGSDIVDGILSNASPVGITITRFRGSVSLPLKVIVGYKKVDKSTLSKEGKPKEFKEFDRSSLLKGIL